MIANEKTMVRFWKKVCVSDGCWDWIGAIGINGYGRLYVNNKEVLAHRFSWAIHNGYVPNGLFVCHKCDRSQCVNPSHLFIGTSNDNMIDMKVKGRSSRGESRHSAKLTNEQVIEIFKKCSSPDSCSSSIAKDYGVTWRVVHRIRRRERWAWLTSQLVKT